MREKWTQLSSKLSELSKLSKLLITQGHENLLNSSAIFFWHQSLLFTVAVAVENAAFSAPAVRHCACGHRQRSGELINCWTTALTKSGSQEEEVAEVPAVAPPPPAPPVPPPPAPACTGCTAPPSAIFDQIYKTCGPRLLRPNLLAPAFVNFRQVQLLSTMYDMTANGSAACQPTCGRNYVRELNALYCYLADYVLSNLIPGYNRPGVIFSWIKLSVFSAIKSRLIGN